MHTTVWTEPGGPLLRDALRLEARTLHQLHQPPARLEDWLAQRRGLRRRLLDAAGTFPAPPPLDVREHGTLRLDGLRIVKLTYQSRPGLRVTANLYRPDGAGPFPGILNVHGHWQQGKIAARVSGRCQAMAREGFVVLSVDAIGAGERATRPGQFEHHGHQGASLFSIGESLLGMQVYDNMRGIDLLQALPYVDGARIGATGASGGGNQTMWIAALDPRVKAAVPVVSVGTFEAYVTTNNCLCETLPGGLPLAEEWGVLGLTAPNPLLILTAVREGIPAFFLAEMLRSYADVRKIYGLYGREERVDYHAIDLPHGYFPEMQRYALGWLRHWLAGDASALPRPVPAVRELPESRLMCFPGKTRPKSVLSLAAYVHRETAARKQAFLAQPVLRGAAKRQALRRLLRLPEAPLAGRRTACARGEDVDGRFEGFTVEPDPQALVPCLTRLPAGDRPDDVLLVAHAEGKAAAAERPEVRSALARGWAVCLADLRHTGETKWDHPDSTEHLPPTRAELWLGRTMLGQWVRDLQAVRATLVRDGGFRRVALLGIEEGGLAALAAAALDRQWREVAVDRLLASYVIADAPPAQRYSIYLPGVLLWGDVSLLAALSCAPVRVGALMQPSGKPLAARARAAWHDEVRALCRRLKASCPVRLDA